MITEKPLVQFLAYPLAMGACVAISLWILLDVLRIEQLAGNTQQNATTMPHLPIISSDSGLRVKRLQEALISRGYYIGAVADGDFNEDTIAALGTFQDNNALPVEPQCDQQCWTELRVSDPKSKRRP
jgi:peptidoglycan hydrolase-like protein with peptidoglycan-binding domain